MADLLVELGTEELPAPRVRPAAEALRDGLAARLVEAGLLAEGVAAAQPVLGTPRRLAAFLPGVRAAQEDREERVWGPPVAAAFDGAGKPTKAGEGFARSSGVALEAMGRGEKVPGKPPYLYADRVVKGRSAAVVVAEALPAVAAALPFRRTMRWPQSGTPFARPVRSLLCLLGGEVVPCSLAGVAAGRTVRGHAFLAPGAIPIPAADLEGYREALREARVVVDFTERLALVREGVAARWRELGADPAAEPDADLLEEVAGLVEWPTALAGAFDARYGDLPTPVLVTSMARHLRFFPVPAPGGGGTVLPRFVSVTDRLEGHSPGIRAGNERVLRARLYDADFFFRNDRRRRLEAFRPALEGMDFHRGLGTLLDKSERVRRLAVSLCDTLGLSPEVRAAADRGAFLLKCDLLTEVVKEFPELQGLVGGWYARLDGEPAGAAAAVAGQYLAAGLSLRDAARSDPAAALVGMAERADTLAACFSIGEEPTGSADPFGLRRAALALIEILDAREDWGLSLDAVLEPAAEGRGLDGDARGRLRAFLWTRVEQAARADGFTDFVGCLGVAADRPHVEYGERLRALRGLSEMNIWKDLVALVERTGNMGDRAPAGATPPSDLPPEARALEDALAGFMAELDGSPPLAGRRRQDLVRFADAYRNRFGDGVHALFEKVLVDDPAHPDRRAALKDLLHRVFTLFAGRLGDLRLLGSGARPPRP